MKRDCKHMCAFCKWKKKCKEEREQEIPEVKFWVDGKEVSMDAFLYALYGIKKEDR